MKSPLSVAISKALFHLALVLCASASALASPTLTALDASQAHFKDILSDPESRIESEFKVPDELKKRTAFWFDIYTRYGSYHHVIHHSRFPWIVFQVMDFTDEIHSGKGPLWLRVDRANKKVEKRRKQIQLALKKLSKQSQHKNLSPEDQVLYDSLKNLPGSRQKVLKFASTHVRSQLGQKDYFLSGLKRSSRYLGEMEKIFTQAGLPIGLTRMPFVESSFNEKAYSKVGASGIWQIMPATGKAYSLVTNNIDERNSPLKATATAARLLRSYHRALGSWPLAITSYNHGIGNIRKAIRAARSEDLAVIISRYHQGDFRFASANFYTCFLAALYAERYSDQLFPWVVREPPIDFRPIKITRSILLRDFLRKHDVNQSELFTLNLDLNAKAWRQLRLPRNFVIHLPADEGADTNLKQRVAGPDGP